MGQLVGRQLELAGKIGQSLVISGWLAEELGVKDIFSMMEGYLFCLLSVSGLKVDL